ncbi:hypothetical protein [Kribbella sp. NPDC000426]
MALPRLRILPHTRYCARCPVGAVGAV